MLSSTGTTYRPITANFLTRSYRVVGKALITHTGLLGLLSASHTSIIEILEAQLARLDMPNKLADQFEIARMVKSQIVAVCANRREDLGAIGQAGLSAANQYCVHLVTSDYEIDGTLEWSGRFDIGSVMSQSSGDFIPLYRARLSAILIPGINIESPVVLVNRRWIDIIALAVRQAQDEY